MKIYTLILIVEQEDGASGIMPHSYSSEETARENAEIAVESFDDLLQWYITCHTLDEYVKHEQTLH